MILLSFFLRHATLRLIVSFPRDRWKIGKMFIFGKLKAPELWQPPQQTNAGNFSENYAQIKM
jgi:hypothetical protein